MHLIITILNAGLLTTLIIFFYKQYALRSETRLFILALIVKATLGIALGVIYKYQFGDGDLLHYYHQSKIMVNYYFGNDIEVHDVLFENEDAQPLLKKLSFENQPRALLFLKIVYLIYLVTAGNFWMMILYFAIISFMGFWLLFYTIRQHNPELKAPMFVGFFLWPSAAFWSSGMLKESIALFLICLIIALVLRYMFFQRVHAIDFLLWICCAFLLWELKYYYAAILLPVLLSYSLTVLLQTNYNRFRSSNRAVTSFFLCLVLLIVVVSLLHPNLGINRIASVVIHNYHLYTSISQTGKYIDFGSMKNTFDLLASLPLALYSGLFRPGLWDWSNGWSLIVAMENTVLIILFGIAAYLGIKDRSCWNLQVVAVLTYIFLMAIFLAFSAPNFGSLMRYKSSFLPFMLVLILSVPAINQKLNVLFKQLKLFPPD